MRYLKSAVIYVRIVLYIKSARTFTRARVGVKMTVGKKLILSIIALPLLLATIFLGVGARGGEDAAFADEATYLENANDFIELSDRVGSGDNCLGETFVLTSDVDLTDVGFYPIATGNTPFHGVILGDGHTVTLSLNASGISGLIGRLGTSGRVENLVLKGSVRGTGNTGAFVAENSGVVKNCISYATVVGGARNAYTYTGGIVGWNAGTIDSCVNVGGVSAEKRLGGICGSVTSVGKVYSSVNFGRVEATMSGSVEVGGAIGKDEGEVADCYNAGELVVTGSGARIGTVVGESSLTTRTCTNYSLTDSLLPACGSSNDTVGKYEKKTLFDFLSNEGLVFSLHNLARAPYECGYGYLYAPAFLLDESEGNAFISAEAGALFRRKLFGAGEGVFPDSFVVNTLEQWILFKENTKLFDYNSNSISLGADMDIGEHHSLGTTETPFKGFFDGNGHTIALTETSGRSNVGLFAYAENCIIMNLKLSGRIIGGENVGALIASAVGLVDLKSVTNYASVAGKAYVGGLIGKIEGNVGLNAISCVNEGEVHCDGRRYQGKVGGIVGGVYGMTYLTDCFNFGSITSEYGGANCVGGLAGEIASAEGSDFFVRRCANEGNITAKNAEYVGGLVGRTRGNTYAELESTACVATVSGRLRVGGLVGQASGGEISVFTVLGDVSGENYVSGVCGYSGDVTLSLGYFSGKIIETGDHSSDFKAEEIGYTENGSAGTETKIFYNGDKDNRLQNDMGVGMTYVDITEGGLFEDAAFSETTRTIDAGIMPYPSDLKTSLRKTDLLNVSYFAGKNGDNYLLSNEQTLRNFAVLCNSSEYQAFSYELTSDIALTRAFPDIPVFRGTFNGNNHTITGLDKEEIDRDVGFFSVLEGANVSGLFIKGGSIRSVSETARMGTFAGSADENTTLTNCFSTAELKGAANYVGGLVGVNEGKITGSFFAGKITGATNAGGIIGSLSGSEAEIKNSFVSARITAVQRTGGISAETDGGTIESCYVNGRLDGGSTLGGGIVAVARNATVSKTFVLADIQTTGNKGALFGTADSGTIASLGGSECYYNFDYIGFLAYPGASDAQNADFAKQADFFYLNGAGYFTVAGFVNLPQMYNDDKDAFYTKMLSAFTPFVSSVESAYNEDVKKIVFKSAELYIFDRDTSLDGPGSKNNPYRIRTAYQFAMLSTLTKETDFYGKYFFVENDIDLSETTTYSGEAIGFYSAESGYSFRATVYGSAEDRPTISGVDVTKATNKNSQTTTDYLGVFANTEEGFVLKNIVFTGTVTGGSNIGGLVGYTHGGEIENCLSLVSVVSTGTNVGGLVGAVSGSVTVKGSVVKATVTAESGAYGLIGIGAGTAGVTANVQGSWFVTSGANTETYLHNNYGSVLYDFSDENNGQGLTVVQRSSGFGFLTHTGNAYKGYIKDFNNGLIASAFETAYYPPMENASLSYCVRYCREITVRAVTEGGEQTDAASIIASDNYFVGESVTAELIWSEDGKTIGYMFAALKDESGASVPFVLQPSADTVIIEFTMTEDTEQVDFVIKEMSVGDVVTTSELSGVRYDGRERRVTLNVENAEMEIYREDGTSVDIIKDAGEYRIVVRVRQGENGNFIGTYEDVYLVEKKILYLGDSTAFADFYQTTYRKGLATRTEYALVTNDSGMITGVVEGEEIGVFFTLEYADENVGENIALGVIDAYTECSNYTFEETTKSLGNVGVITKKILALEPDYDELGENDERIIIKTYNGNRKPTVSGVYETAVEWNFYKNGSAVSSGFDVDEYDIAPYASGADANNYTVQTKGTYIVRIVPYQVNELIMSVTEFAYTGEKLNETIQDSAQFRAPEIDGYTHAVLLSFYTDSTARTPVENVVNAGDYYCLPTAVDKNFSLENVTTRRIVVSRRTLTSAKITLQKEGETLLGDGTETLQTEDKLKIVFENEDDIVSLGDVNGYDAVVTTGSYYFTAREENGEWFVIPVAGTDNATFTVTFSGATNYIDRASERTFSFSVQKKKLGVTLTQDRFEYGDAVIDDYSFKYYYLNDDETLGEEKDKSEIDGLEEAGVSFGASVLNVGTYTLSYSGGASNGYEFVFMTRTVTVVPKPIRLVINQTLGKIYGENDPEIPYVITAVDEDGNVVTLHTLPDGSEIELNGKLGREKGEETGEYAFTKGTLTPEANRNYDIDYSGTELYRFYIEKRDLFVSIERNQGKDYGDEDGAFKLEAVNGTAFVNNPLLNIKDDESVLHKAILVTREEGEVVGYYEYYVAYDYAEVNKLNYNITYIDSDGNYYAVRRVSPIMNFDVLGAVSYGDDTNSVAKRVSVVDSKGNALEGEIDVYVVDPTTGEKRYTILKTDTTLTASFTPTDKKNYSSTVSRARISVLKRSINAVIMVTKDDVTTNANGELFPYSATRINERIFSVVLVDPVSEGDEFTYTVTIEGDAKNVSEKGFTVKGTIESDLYELSEEAKATCHITKGVVTVKLADGTLKEGDTFTPTISYTGFVGGENRTALSVQASVGSVPNKRGVYVLTPSGAKSDNYDFIYQSGIITVTGKTATADGISVKGEISADYSINVTELDDEAAMADVENDLNKSVGYSMFKPNSYKMKEFYTVKETARTTDKEYTYTVLFAKLNETDKIYIRLGNGAGEEAEYEAEETDDGYLVTFTTTETVYGVGRFEKKETMDLIKGYWLYGIIGGGALALILIIILVSVFIKKVSKPKEYDFMKGHWVEKGRK